MIECDLFGSYLIRLVVVVVASFCFVLALATASHNRPVKCANSNALALENIQMCGQANKHGHQVVSSKVELVGLMSNVERQNGQNLAAKEGNDRTS